MMEILLSFASEGIKGVPNVPDLLHRAVAGGFTALTDKVAELSGIKISLLPPPPGNDC